MLKHVLLLLALHGSAALDGWQTRRYFDMYRTQRDLNPLVRIGQNTPAVYLTTQIDAVAVDVLSLTRWGKRHRRVMDLLTGAVISEHLTLANYNAASVRLGEKRRANAAQTQTAVSDRADPEAPTPTATADHARLLHP